ncbi:pinopsin-like [Acanthaster planci]|uniref:Pinopsin-like n=1 Tax=Acanthaster planci TaxID=133434 RepID=A0A8B7Z2M3_ACAPL|nr:pinopsin-like [Acanthaster planci]
MESCEPMAATVPTASLLATAGNVSQLEPYLSRSAFTGLAVYLAVVCLLSFVGDALVIFLYARYRALHNVVNIFLLNICVADSIVAVLGNSLSFVSTAAGHWLFGSAGCTWYGFVCTLSGCAQIVGIAAISLQRFFFVVKPFVARRLTTRGALVCVGFIWAYSLVAALPPALGWNEFVPEGLGTFCSVNWQTGSRSYTFFIFFMILVLPLSVIVFSYTKILVTVKKDEALVTAQRNAEMAELTQTAVPKQKRKPTSSRKRKVTEHEPDLRDMMHNLQHTVASLTEAFARRGASALHGHPSANNLGGDIPSTAALLPAQPAPENVKQPGADTVAPKRADYYSGDEV